MFLADWYFCKSVHLSIKDTSEFLNSLSTLRDCNTPADDRVRAFETIRHMDTLNCLYALPVLTDCLLSAESREKYDISDPRNVRFSEAVKSFIQSLIPRISDYPYLNAAVDELDSIEYEKAAQYLDEQILKSSYSEIYTGYVDMESCAAEILALSLLRSIASYVPDALLDILDTNRSKPWYTAALHRHLGDLPWALAIETLSLCHKHISSLLEYFPAENWIIYPDKLDLAAVLYCNDRRMDIGRLLKETFELRKITELYTQSRLYELNNEIFMTDPGADKDNQLKYIAVFWQLSIWYIAAKVNPEETVTLLETYWDIPKMKNKSDGHLTLRNEFQKKLSVRRNYYNFPTACSAVCSPWIAWEYHSKSPDKVIAGFGNHHPDVFRKPIILRAFAVTFIMKMLFRALPVERKIPDYLLRLLLCYGDVFESELKHVYHEVTGPGETSSMNYPADINSFLVCAYINVMDLGTGRVNAHVADDVVGIISRESPIFNTEYKGSWLHRNLFSEPALMTAATWSHESLSNVTYANSMEENAWLRGGYRSNGATICRWYFNELWDYIESKHRGAMMRGGREAVQLAYQVYPEIIRNSERTFPWYVLLKDQRVVSTRKLLLTSEINCEDWSEIVPVSPENYPADAYSIGLSMRLRSLLEENADLLGIDRSWIDQWSEHFYSVSSKAELSRVCRYILIDMLTAAAPTEEQAEIFLDVCKLIIDVIVEFSDDAPYYLQRLAKTLSEPLSLGEKSAVLLRQHMLKLLLYYAEYEEKNDRADQIKTQLLPYYIMMLEREIQRDSDFRKAFFDRRHDSRFAFITANADSVKANSFLGHEFYRRASTDFSSVYADYKMPFVADFYDGFTEQGVLRDSAWKLGVVYQYAEKDNLVTLTVNAGKYGLLNVSVPKNRRFNYYIGDLVAVKNSEPPQICYLYRSDTGAETVRAKEVVIEGGAVIVKIAGVSHYSTDGNASQNIRALSLWNPDTCAFLAAEKRIVIHDGCEVTQEKTNDNKLLWKPVEHSFNDLIVRRLLAPGDDAHTVSLVYIERTSRDYLFSAAAGENYRLKENDWAQDSLQAFLEKLAEHNENEACGLKVNVQLTKSSNGAPKLMLATQSAFDDTNIIYKRLFQENQPLIVKRDGEIWNVDLDTEDRFGKISARFVGAWPESESEEQETLVSENGWDLIAQRMRKLKVIVLKEQSLPKELFKKEEIKNILDIYPGKRLSLSSVMPRQTNGYHSALTNNNIWVRAAAESVSWETGRDFSKLYSLREAVVENVHYYPNAFQTDAVPCQLDESKLEGATEFKGIVSRISSMSKDRRNEAKGLFLDANIIINDKSVLLKNVPRSAFSPIPNMVGEVFSAEKTSDGWIFKSRPREIRVRALWRIIDHPEPDEKSYGGLYLKITEVHGFGLRIVTQDPKEPILHLWDPKFNAELKVRNRQTFKQGDGNIQYIGSRFSSPSVFKWAFNTNIVRLIVGNCEYIGESADGEFKGVLSSWNRFQLCLHNVDMQDNTSLYRYDMRRVFFADSKVKRVEKRIDDYHFEQWQRSFDEWCRSGGDHASGAIKVSKDGQKVLILDNLWLPENGNRNAERESWTNAVKLSDDRPFVSGRNYSSNMARARLYLKNENWLASIRDCRPMSVDEFVSYFDVSPPGRVLNITMFYAGCDDDYMPRFEWGYGYTLVVDPEHLEIENASFGEYDLFFGDRISRVTLKQREDQSWMIHIDHQDISYEIESQVWQDASHDVVQQIRIQKDKHTESIVISEVSVSVGSIVDASENNHHWEFARIRNALLNQDSLNFAQEALSGEDDTAVVLARLDMSENKKTLRALRFDIISDAHNALHKGDILCMIGGIIAPKFPNNSRYIGNDYKIDFELSPELKRSLNEPFTVNVLRRAFSYDESVLRVQHRSDPKAYCGHYMMVRLVKDVPSTRGGKVWNGSVVHGLQRSARRLSEWVREQKNPLAILGEHTTGHTVVEIAPGIISRIEYQRGFRSGMLVELYEEDSVIKARSILGGDGEYIPRTGRPVELLIMDGTWKKVKDESTRDSSFTIAGLPQISFSDQALMQQEMKNKPPRYGFLYRAVTDGRTKYSIDSSEKVNIGYLSCVSQQDTPQILTINTNSRDIESGWHMLSFCDDTITNIYRHAEMGRWYYHEQFTGIFVNESEEPVKLKWPTGNRFNRVPLFFDSFWRLRYSKSDISRFVFPARAVTENGLPEDGCKYPVAYGYKKGVYIELIPGKIVDIPSAILVAGKKRAPLSDMCSKVFASGDTIQMKMAKTGSGVHSKIQIIDFRFGLRGYFNDGRASLPITQVLDGGLVVGCDRMKMTVPCANSSDYREGELVSLRSDRYLKKLTSIDDIPVNETVMVKLKQNRFQIVGLSNDDLRVYHNKKADKNWVDRALEQNPKALLKGIRCLPVRIVTKAVTNEMDHVWFSYSQPDFEDQIPGTQFPCTCLGEYFDTNDNMHFAVMRSGAYLFRMNVSTLLPCSSRKVQSSVIQLLAENQTSLWVYSEEDGYACGLSRPVENETVVQLICSVPKANGILCRDISTLSLYWLPADEASRAEGASPDDLLEVLPRECVASIQDDGTISLIKTQESFLQFSNLGLNDRQLRVIPQKVVDEDKESGEYRYLCTRYPKGDVFRLVSETELELNENPIPVEITLKKEKNVETVPCGMRRIPLDLPVWVFETAQKSRSSENYLDTELFKSNLPDVFKKHRSILRRKAGNTVDYHDLEETLLWLYVKNVYAASISTEHMKWISKSIAMWLKTVGLQLATGFDASFCGSHVQDEINLLTSTAAVLLLNKIGEQDPESAQLAVHLVRMLGNVCGGNIHQEMLLRYWFMSDEKDHKSKLWRRLNKLVLHGQNIANISGGKKIGGIRSGYNPVFNGKMTQDQLSELSMACVGIMGRSSENLLVLTAQALAFAAGMDVDYRRLYNSGEFKRTKCYELSRLGRALIPGKSSHIAVEKLDVNHVLKLQSVSSTFKSEWGIPLMLLTRNTFPISDSDKEWASSLCKDVIRKLTEQNNS